MIIYVNDINIFDSFEKEIKLAQKDLASEFEMKDLELVDYYLDMNVSYGKDDSIHLCQETFIHQLIERYGLQDLKPSKISMNSSFKLRTNVEDRLSQNEQKRYHSMMSSLNYLATVSRLDIVLFTEIVARFCANSNQEHVNVVQQIYAYLIDTTTIESTYRKKAWKFQGFVDNDWAECPDTRRSTTDFVFELARESISWVAKRQKTVALSTCEAEYVAAAKIAKEAVWLKHLINELNAEMQVTEIPLHIDNNAAMKLAKDSEFHERTKHIELRHHFLRGRVLDDDLSIIRVNIKENVADILTKPLSRIIFEYLREKLDLTSKPQNDDM